MSILAFDTETSGLDSSVHSILTIYMCVLDDRLNLVDELDLALKPDSGNLVYDQEALNVNKINLDEHLVSPNTKTYSEASELIETFLKKHANGRSKLSPAGHNISFDEDMIIGTKLLSKEKYSKYISHRKLDTSPIVNLFKLVGWFPPEIGKLETLCKHLGVPLSGAHNAKVDTLAFVNCLRKIVLMLKDKKSSVTGLDQDILLSLER